MNCKERAFSYIKQSCSKDWLNKHILENCKLLRESRENDSTIKLRSNTLATPVVNFVKHNLHNIWKTDLHNTCVSCTSKDRLTHVSAVHQRQAWTRKCILSFYVFLTFYLYKLVMNITIVYSIDWSSAGYMLVQQSRSSKYWCCQDCVKKKDRNGSPWIDYK